MEYLSMEEKKKIKSGIEYKNSKWRPNVFIDADKREVIENWLKDHRYKSINEYLFECLKRDNII